MLEYQFSARKEYALIIDYLLLPLRINYVVYYMVKCASSIVVAANYSLGNIFSDGGTLEDWLESLFQS